MTAETELLKGSTQTLALAVLKEAPRHGYAIAREIERRSGNALQFKEGTLYPTLHALERDGFIVGGWSKENGGRERRVYTITESGLLELERRAQVWNNFVSAIQSVIVGEQRGDSHEPSFPSGTAASVYGNGPQLRPEPAS